MALAKLDLASGRPTAGFQAAVEWRVDDLVAHGGRLYVAGAVTRVNGVARSGLAAVDAQTGALDPGVAVAFTDSRNTLLIVNRIAIRRDGSRLVATGSFLKADGQDRPQLAVLDLEGGTARLADWHTNGYAAPCRETSTPTCGASTSRPTARSSSSSPPAHGPDRCATPSSASSSAGAA